MVRAAGSRSRTAPVARPGMWRGFSRPRLTGRAPAPGHERDTADEHRHAQPLTHGHAKGEEAEERVGLACKLGKEAQHRVADEEHRRDLAARTRLRREPPEK